MELLQRLPLQRRKLVVAPTKIVQPHLLAANMVMIMRLMIRMMMMMCSGRQIHRFEAAKQRIQEQLNAVTAEMVMPSANEPDQEKKPQKAKKLGPANGTVTKKAADKAGAAQNGVGANSYETLIEEIEGNLSKESTPGQLHTFLGSVTESPQEVMTALFEALFNGAGKGFAKEVCKKMNYISAAVHDEGSQMLLLRVIEAFCGKCGADAVKEVALVLKVLSDGDVLEDESIVRWYKEGLAGGKNSQALKNAKPFVEWLQNAESE